MFYNVNWKKKILPPWKYHLFCLCLQNIEFRMTRVSILMYYHMESNQDQEVGPFGETTENDTLGSLFYSQLPSVVLSCYLHS